MRRNDEKESRWNMNNRKAETKRERAISTTERNHKDQDEQQKGH